VVPGLITGNNTILTVVHVSLCAELSRTVPTLGLFPREEGERE